MGVRGVDLGACRLADRTEHIQLNQFLLTLANLVPKRVKRLILGKQEAPSWVANRIHGVLNRAPVERYPCLECSGPLKGYRMRIDWQRYRGFLYGTWEPDVVQSIQNTVREGWVAVDAGAHIGYYTLLLARLVGSAGRVFAFEPMTANFDVLRENISLNGLTQAEAINKAVVNQTGPLQLSLPEQGDLPEGTSVHEFRGVRPVTVDAVALDDFFADRRRRVDFLKMDVEGAEADVLRGARALIETDHPTMEIEIHHFDGHRDRNPVPAMLEEWGYRVDWIDVSEAWTSHVLATWPQSNTQPPKGTC